MAGDKDEAEIEADNTNRDVVQEYTLPKVSSKEEAGNAAVVIVAVVVVGCLAVGGIFGCVLYSKKKANTQSANANTNA